MLSTIDALNDACTMKSNACEAWQLLLNFFFSQRANLPPLAAEFENIDECLVPSQQRIPALTLTRFHGPNGDTSIRSR